jgi:predicted dehydrogenase
MAGFTRRRFLEDSLLAAAAAVAAGPVGRVWAADVQPASPNEKLGVAVLGVNGRGRDHINAYQGRSDVEILYIVDPDTAVGEGRAAAVSSKQKIKCKSVRDMREAFDDKAVDVISVATPNHWHTLAAIWAMQAGKDVYLEKPVSHNVSEGRRAAEAARKYGRICQTGTQCRSIAGATKAIHYVHEGKIGEVKLARGLCYKRRKSIGPAGTYPVPASVDYDLWSGPATIKPVTRPRFHYDWHWQYHYGNGDMGNQGPHQMDLCRWGLGVDRLSERVISYGGRLGYEDAGDSANTQVAIHTFGDKELVFEVRGLETPPLRGVKIGCIFYGSEGYLVMGSYETAAALDLKGNVVEKFSGGGNHYDNFIKAVRSRKPEDLTAEVLEGHLSAGLAHTGTVSYRLGEQMPVEDLKRELKRLDTVDDPVETLERTVAHLKENGVDLAKTPVTLGPVLSMDPSTETFLGNATANELLTREYRKPFVVPGPGEV